MAGTPSSTTLDQDTKGADASDARAAVITFRRPYDWRAAIPAAVIALLSLSLLIVAARLDPDPTGVNTHTQLGIAPCGFLGRTGLPCATCGMTTAFALAADGRLIAAFITQPAGALLALLAAVTAIVTGYAAFAGLNLLPLATLLWRPIAIILLGAVVISAWAYKILTMHGV